MTAAKPPSEGVDQARQAFLESGDALAVLEQRSRAVEDRVIGAWMDHLAPAFPAGAALLAVGGFGRRELFPYSDIDVCILVDHERAAVANKSVIADFLQALWDSGLRVSHSVRTPAECCELHDHNIELNISLLDQRLLAGDGEIYGRFEPRLRKFFENQRLNLARHLSKLGRSRHGQYHNTIYHLEPNLKEGPGGLRDLHLLGWFRTLATPGASDVVWSELLDPGRDLLFLLRCFLHYRFGRDNNVLSFDAQEELPEQSFSGHQTPELQTPELWMRAFYRNARAIHGAAARAMEASETKGNNLLAGFLDWRSRLSNSDFTVARDRLYFKAPQAIANDPELALRLFQFVARHGIRPAIETERRLAEMEAVLRQFFSASRPLWPAFRELLALPHAAMALRAMQDTGVLRLVFPEWESIEACVVRDFYHRYTVDEHTLVSIESLQELARRQEPGHRRFSTLLAEVEDRAILTFALLFHDVGKGERTGAHSEESTRLAVNALDRIRTPERHRRMIVFLIDQHLALSSAMSRDLNDPVTARALADRVGTIEALKYLTLLTYADISAVNPSALSPWRLEQLWRVYLVTQHELTRELQTDRIEAPPAPSSSRQSFLKGLPVRYLRTHTEDEIKLHLDLEERRKEAEVALDVRKTEAGYLLTVLAKDRMYLFSSVAGALSSFGMNILKAEAFANQQGTILDTFLFEDPVRTLELNPTEADRLQLTLERVILGRMQVKELLRNRPKPSPPSKRSGIEPRIAFDNSASDTATLVEIIAEDRPGLLYDIASAFSGAGCNIELVLVDTEAHKAMDVFYVSMNGRKLAEQAMMPLRRALEAACRGA
ncbi:MAG: ACT domain-containing protein [Acidobacteria bacterium]|nr:ACT domain-containing protein [Acidobacteriota bacterium]